MTSTFVITVCHVDCKNIPLDAPLKSSWLWWTVYICQGPCSAVASDLGSGNTQTQASRENATLTKETNASSVLCSLLWNIHVSLNQVNVFVTLHVKKLCCHGLDIANPMNINMNCVWSLGSNDLAGHWHVNVSRIHYFRRLDRTNSGQKSKLSDALSARSRMTGSKWDTDEDLLDKRAQIKMRHKWKCWDKSAFLAQRDLGFWTHFEWPPAKLGERG